MGIVVGVLLGFGGQSKCAGYALLVADVALDDGEVRVNGGLGNFAPEKEGLKL